MDTNATQISSDPLEDLESEIFLYQFLLSISWAILGSIILHWRRYIIFHCIRSFLTVILNIFFKSIDVVGAENVPLHGPVIFVGNHQNQFVDGLMLQTKSPRNISLLVAAKSMSRPLVGLLAGLLNSIPVHRPQDEVKIQKGILLFKKGSTIVKGDGTDFTKSLKIGDTLILTSAEYSDAKSVKIQQILEDDKIQTESPFYPIAEDEEENEDMYIEHRSTYKSIPKIDHSSMYKSVYEMLDLGHCIGLFPEGGSHDRTELLPLKPGVALMSLSAMSKNPNMARVCILPCGLTYFHGHKFRSRCVIEYGSPIYLTQEMVREYTVDRNAAVAKLMAKVETGLRAVTINVPDYKTLNILYAARRLYTPSHIHLSVQQTLKLNQRFALGYDRFKDEEEIQEITQEVSSFVKVLKRHGLKRADEYISRKQLFWKIFYVLILATLALIPGLLLNAPVGAVAKLLSLKEASKSVKNSKVKIVGADVIASYKILVVMVMMPLWFTTCSLLLILFGGMNWYKTIVAIISLPLFSYLGIMFAEQGVITSKSLKPLLLRLIPKYQNEYKQIRVKNKELSNVIRRLVDSWGPKMGDEFWSQRVITPDQYEHNESQMKRNQSFGFLF